MDLLKKMILTLSQQQDYFKLLAPDHHLACIAKFSGRNSERLIKFIFLNNQPCQAS